MKKISLKFKTLLIVFLGIMLVTNCKDSQKNTIFWPMALSGESPVTTSSANPQSNTNTTNPAETVQPGSFTSFGLTSPKVTGTIDGTNITVMVPANTPSLSSFIATFVHNGASVSINGTSQVSGVTVNDFTSPLTYTVTDKDGTTKIYTITVKRYYPIAGTGITKCYDNAGSEITCGNSDYPNQDGDSKKPQPSFTGPTQNATYPNDYTTTDNIIGNVWKTCTEGLSGADCGIGTATTSNQPSAMTACSNLNAANGGNGYAGRTDWRLPNVEELVNLIDFSKSGIAIDESKFPSTVSGYYWASIPGAANNRWGVTSYVYSLLVNPYSGNSYTRCIAGSSLSTYSFSDNSNGTITDYTRGLVWQKCTIGQTGTNTCTGNATKLIWNQALHSCNSLSLAGKKWRLPNAKELLSLINYPIINIVVPNYISQIMITETYSSATTGKLKNGTINIEMGYNSANPDFASSFWEFPNSMDTSEGYVADQWDKTRTLNVRCVADLD